MASLGLDIGEKRIGIASADSVPIAVALMTLVVDGSEKKRLMEIITTKQINRIIVGRPRNQSGYETAQTAVVLHAAEQLLSDFVGEIIFQDESLTSVVAETTLMTGGKSYQKSDIDALAAALILQDYLDTYNGRSN